MPVWVLRNLPALDMAAALAGAVWWLIDVVNDRTQLRADLAATEMSLAGAHAELQRAAETADQTGDRVFRVKTIRCTAASPL